jgi:ATP:corrinoid adenosyltransferase
MDWTRFVEIRKVDAAKREVHGVMAEEARDKSGEIFDYESSKPYVKEWSEGFEKDTDGKSAGNVRAQHGKVAAGKLVSIAFDDANKCIPVVAKIVDNNEWEKVQEGVYTGFSIGGSYVKRWADGSATRYTAKPSEVSIVDNPCMYGAKFTMVKADGAVEEKNFQQGVNFVVPASLEKQVAAAIEKLMEENSEVGKDSMDLKKFEELAKAVEAQGVELDNLKKMSAENQAHLHGMLIHHAGMGSHLEKMANSCAKSADGKELTEAEKAAKAAELAKAAAASNAGGNAELATFKAEVTKAITDLTEIVKALAKQPATTGVVATGKTEGESGKAATNDPAPINRFVPGGVHKGDVANQELEKALSNGKRISFVPASN